MAPGRAVHGGPEADSLGDFVVARSARTSVADRIGVMRNWLTGEVLQELPVLSHSRVVTEAGARAKLKCVVVWPPIVTSGCCASARNWASVSASRSTNGA